MTPLTYSECITRLNKHLVLANKHDFKWLVWDKRRGKQAACFSLCCRREAGSFGSR